MKPNIYKDSHIQKLKGTTNIGKKKKGKKWNGEHKFVFLFKPMVWNTITKIT